MQHGTYSLVNNMSKDYCAVRISEEKNLNITVLCALIFSVMLINL